MKIRHASVAFALALTCLLADGASAATRYVNQACPTSGTGVADACGPTGAYRTLGEAVMAAGCGDVVFVHDGRYREQLTLATRAGYVGKPLSCPAASPVTFTAAPNEHPIITGWYARADWRSVSGAVWSRVMEASPTVDPGDDDRRDVYDPGILYEATGLPLAYAGDNVAAANLRPDSWTYASSTHTVTVNSMHPTLLRVPHFPFGAYVKGSTNVVLDGLRIEGVRFTGIEFGQSNPTSVVALLNMEISGFLRFGMHGHSNPGLRVENALVEWGCRGASFVRGGWGGCFGMRFFGAHNAHILRNVVQHLGFIANCTWCSAPWNDGAHTAVPSTGNGIQAKQTGTYEIGYNTISDCSTQAIFGDVSRFGNIHDNLIDHTRGGIRAGDFTPQPSCCPSTADTCYCNASDNDIRWNRLSNVGGTGYPGGCVLYVENPTQRCSCSRFLADVSFNNVNHPNGQAFCFPTGAAGFSQSNNVIDGTDVTTTSTTRPSTTTTRPSTTTTTSSSTSTTTTPCGQLGWECPNPIFPMAQCCAGYVCVNGACVRPSTTSTSLAPTTSSSTSTTHTTTTTSTSSTTSSTIQACAAIGEPCTAERVCCQPIDGAGHATQVSCSSSGVCEPTPPPTTETGDALCSDGVDNDGLDGADCADPKCATFSGCPCATCNANKDCRVVTGVSLTGQCSTSQHKCKPCPPPAH